ncbi:hypothetical protein A3F37_00810 [Candidatus Saccharibacteria bacterium RIFCSPHIGHO2_12_FULL_41_12]|nr:MAG: hypothetical protein A3F37_00810 [Candidatus Saccharibacteria bacterium RIFCSPHIGHO2_12_FULL_41_12]
MVSAVVSYKLGNSSKRRLKFQMLMWTIILVGLAAAKPLYEWLFSNNLTQSEPLSLFDVVQITGIVTVFYIANRTRTKLETLERQTHDLHQELSIRLFKDRKSK